MKNLIFLFAFSLLCLNLTAQEIVGDSTYLQAVNDTTFYVVKEVRYSNGTINVDKKLKTADEVVSNFKSFLEFQAREMLYAANAAQDIQRKSILVKNANAQLAAVGSDFLNELAAQYHVQLTGSYQLNGTTVNLTYTDNALRWINGNQSGSVTCFASDFISLNAYYNGKDLFLYLKDRKWSSCDGLFEME